MLSRTPARANLSRLLLLRVHFHDARAESNMLLDRPEERGFIGIPYGIHALPDAMEEQAPAFRK